MVRLETERRRLEESINEARVRRDHAKAELERAQALYSAGAIAQRQLETTDAAYRIAESSLATIIAQRDAVAGARIPDLSPSATIATSVMTAPISGTVVRVSKSDGERVAAGDVILEILDPSVVWIEVPIFERDLPRLGNSAGGLVTTPATPGKEFRGRLVDAGAMVNRETRAATMVLEVPNPDRALRVGVQANVRLDADERASVVMIPREAVLESEGKHFVYVLVSGQHFQRREVVVGDEYGEKLAITGGLKPEERVVTQGAYQLHQHQLRPSAPGAHTHET
jgi:RND family efflux transporter MFP subunit